MPLTMRDANELFLAGTKVLARAEANGIRVDTQRLEQELQRVAKGVEEGEKELKSDKLYKLWTKRFKENTNLDSREQLADILFKDAGFTSGGTTKTGRHGTGKAVLEKIDHPFVKKYLKVAQLKKTGGTFLKGIKRELVGDLLHPSFSINLNSTFRSSSQNPNFQNLPTRDQEMAKSIRSCFIPRKGKRRIVETDFKGVEVCVAGSVTKDPVLVNYIMDPKSDMHRDTAMELFSLTKEQVDKKTTRDWTKNRFVFPEFYGSVYFQCAPHLWEGAVDPKAKLPGTETTVLQHLHSKGIKKLGTCDPKGRPKLGTFEYRVKEVEDSFWNKRFRVYSQWKKRVWQEYLETGSLTMVTGFTCKWGNNGPLKRNEVTNYYIQGPAFHCLLWTMIQMQDWLDRKRMKTLIVGEIHDSIIADVPDDELNSYLDKVNEVVSVDLPRAWDWICVPMTVEAEVCPIDGSWYEKKEFALINGTWKAKE